MLVVAAGMWIPPSDYDALTIGQRREFVDALAAKANRRKEAPSWDEQ